MPIRLLPTALADIPLAPFPWIDTMCNHYHPLSTNTPALFDASFTRRRFLGTLGMISAAATVPSFVSSSAEALTDTNWHTTSKPGVPEDRVLVVVQLSGGNDGLNCVVPFGDANYYRSRPQLAIRENDVIQLEGVDGIGLNPGLAPLRELMQQGRAAIINGVGYPNPNRSHFKSMDIWHSAVTEERQMRGKGWVGKAMDTAYPLGRDGITPDAAAMACISLGNSTPMAVQGEHVKPVSFQTPEAFRWTARELHPALSDAYDAIHDTPPNTATDDPLAFIHRTQCNAQAASQQVRSAVAGRSEINFPRNNALGQQLEMVAKMVRAELPTRVYYVTLGGFDTHAQQLNRHNALMQQFAQAMKAFYEELDRTGHSDRVVTLAFSEFGRRLRQNASGGTDHGVAGPAFVFGKPVNAGVHGSYPSLTNLDNGDLIHTTDFRSVYADILDNWMQINARQTLGRRYDPLGLFAE